MAKYIGNDEVDTPPSKPSWNSGWLDVIGFVGLVLLIAWWRGWFG